MSKPHKIKTLILLWLSILFSIWLIGKLIPAIILPIIALGVSIHIIRLSPPNTAAGNPQEPLAAGLKHNTGQ